MRYRSGICANNISCVSVSPNSLRFVRACLRVFRRVRLENPWQWVERTLWRSTVLHFLDQDTLLLPISRRSLQPRGPILEHPLREMGERFVGHFLSRNSQPAPSSSQMIMGLPASHDVSAPLRVSG